MTPKETREYLRGLIADDRFWQHAIMRTDLESVLASADAAERLERQIDEQNGELFSLRIRLSAHAAELTASRAETAALRAQVDQFRRILDWRISHARNTDEHRAFGVVKDDLLAALAAPTPPATPEAK